jgi:PBSX family phage terminase large subunit
VSTIDLNRLFPEAPDGTRGPLPKQQQCMNFCLTEGSPQFIAYFGGYGSGKSLILCVINIIWGVLFGGEYVIARQFMPELRRTTYQVFKEILPKELLIEERVADAQFRIKSRFGEAKFHFVGLDEPGKLDSLNLSGVSIDEASQTSEEAMLKLQGRLRNPKGLKKMLLVGNPKGHDFIYKYFIKQDCFKPFFDPVGKREVSVEEQKRNYKIIIAPSTENKHLPPNYVAAMLSTYSKERIERDIMGSFDSFQGQIYTELARDIHVIKPFRIPDDWHRFMSADHGFRNAACFGWWAVDYDSNLYLYRSFYKNEWIIEEICKGNPRTGEPGIIEMNGREGRKEIWIDPSTKANRGKDSDWQTYLDHLPKDWSLVPANNEVAAGIDRVKQYLKLDERTGKPRLYIFDTCSEVIDEMFKYRWDELSPGQEANKNQKEQPVKKDDHGPDMVRYGVMSRPEEPKKADTSAKKRQAATLEASISRELHDLKRGGGGYKDPWGETYIKDSYDNE